MGGGPPARSPHASLRLGVIDLEARPGPAAAHGHRSQATPLPTGTAAKPRRSPWASQGPRALRFLADLLCVVTNVVNRRCFSCGFLSRCYKCRQSDGSFAENSGFGRRLTTFVTGVLTRGFKLLRFDDVCNGYCSRVPWPGHTIACGRRGQALLDRRPGCLKLPSPLRACAYVGLKPSSPLRVRNGRFWRVFRLQWRRRFQRLLFRGVQW